MERLLTVRWRVAALAAVLAIVALAVGILASIATAALTVTSGGNAGCGTPSTGDLCGSASDSGGPGVASDLLNLVAEGR